MTKTIKIYCEGTKNSLDYEILHKIIGDSPVQIQPIGSKRGAESVIQKYEDIGTKTDAYIFFRDRDFDVAVPKKPSLIIKKNVHYSYRTTIENYLLDASCFFEFLKAAKINEQYKIHTLKDVQNVFIKAAKKISYYQALRHTIARMRPSYNCRTTWIKGNSGALPYKIEDNAYCCEQAFEHLKNAFTETVISKEEVFDVVLNTFYERFDNDDFYQNAQYLIWFQGKDFAKALSLLLPQCPIKDYYQFAKKHFDYTQFEDLVELRKIIGLG